MHLEESFNLAKGACMTELLYHADSYLKEFQATVRDVTKSGIVLDRTAFYPGGGGQPNDIGVIRIGDVEYVVPKVSRVDGAIVHQLEGGLPNIGDTVTGALDWDRRHKLMRTHTSLHILCGVIWRDYSAQVTGGNMEPLAARMDFEFENLTAEFAEEVEATVNKEIDADYPISARVLPRDEAMAIPDLIRTKINLLPEGIPEVRVLEIHGLDLQADGGTHVTSTKEVGRIRIVGHESKGRINKRLRIQIEDA
jgi:misacylated tRNA(Ala) deacylase